MKLPAHRQSFGELISKLSNSVVTVSESVKKHFYSELNTLVSVIYPQPKLDFDPIYRRTKSSKFRFAIIASFQEGKGHEVLFGAIPYLSEYFDKFEVYFYGTGSQNDLQRLRDQLNKSEVESHVKIMSFEKDRRKIYSNIDAVIVTSIHEAFGRVPVEAAQCGISVIYANSGGPTEYMSDGVNGLAFIPGDSKSLAKAMSLMLDDFNLVYSLTKNGNQVIQELGKKGTVSEQFIRSLGHRPFNPDKRLQNSILIGVNLAERDTALAERDTALAERDTALAERDTALAERDTALAERDTALAEREAVLNSKSWKLTKPYRDIRSSITACRNL